MTAAEALELELEKVDRIVRKALESGPFNESTYYNSAVCAAIACSNAIDAMCSPKGIDPDAIRAAAITLVLFAVKARLECAKPRETN